MNKIGRNELCPCGSGKKYKNCCLLNTPTNSSRASTSIEKILEFVKFGLSKESADGYALNNKINIRNILLINSDTLVCEFFPYSQDSIGIKTEIGFIISFLEAFFRDNLHTPEIENYGVKAFDENNQEILYALSSKQAARAIGNGQAIEWLKNTIFEDNSEDFRLQQTKRKISEIEHALRRLICNILSKKDEYWWANCIRRKIRDSAENAFENQKGVTISLGDELIDFTYLLQLKTIIIDNWRDFSSIFSNKNTFENSIESLNVIRRNEAHNRTISHSEIKDLEILYNDLLSCISIVLPEIVPKFLIDNWRMKLKKIINEHSMKINKIEVKKEDSLPEISIKIKDMIVQLENINQQIGSILIPPGKKVLHQELINIFEVLKNSFKDLLQSAQEGDMIAFEEAYESNIKANRMVQNYTNKILMSEL